MQCGRPDCSPLPPLDQRIKQALETIRPALQRDGGDVEYVSVNDSGVVQVRFRGACAGCMAAATTLTHGVERTLKELVPEVTKVVLA